MGTKGYGLQGKELMKALNTARKAVSDLLYQWDSIRRILNTWWELKNDTNNKLRGVKLIRAAIREAGLNDPTKDQIKQVKEYTHTK